MLLAVDIGNTATKFGVFDGENLVKKFDIPTRRDVTASELGKMVGDRTSYVTDAIVSSVVPEVNEATRSYLTELAGQEPRFIKPTDDLGLTYHFPIENFGADRLINSFAAAEIYGTPCIAVSFGTATTIDAVSKDREYLGGLIAPGVRAMAKALEMITSKLPEVELTGITDVVAERTEDAIRAGLLYSQIGLVETAIPRIKRSIGENAAVVATGGFATLIGGECAVIDHIEPDLTLLGLKMLYSRA